jgi:Family of unknown function (DUF6529)
MGPQPFADPDGFGARALRVDELVGVEPGGSGGQKARRDGRRFQQLASAQGPRRRGLTLLGVAAFAVVLLAVDATIRPPRRRPPTRRPARRRSPPHVLVHSLLGCFFYGVFVAKMLLLQRQGAPRWGLPLLGGAVFVALTDLWLTSALWFFTTTGLTS